MFHVHHTSAMDCVLYHVLPLGPRQTEWIPPRTPLQQKEDSAMEGFASAVKYFVLEVAHVSHFYS